MTSEDAKPPLPLHEHLCKVGMHLWSHADANCPDQSKPRAPIYKLCAAHLPAEASAAPPETTEERVRVAFDEARKIVKPLQDAEREVEKQLDPDVSGRRYGAMSQDETFKWLVGLDR